MKDLVQKTEIVFMDEHFCNDNLKVRGLDEAIIESEKLIEDNEKRIVSLEECAKKYDENADAKKARLESNEVAL